MLFTLQTSQSSKEHPQRLREINASFVGSHNTYYGNYFNIDWKIKIKLSLMEWIG